MQPTAHTPYAHSSCDQTIGGTLVAASLHTAEVVHRSAIWPTLQGFGSGYTGSTEEKNFKKYHEMIRTVAAFAVLGLANANDNGLGLT